MAANAANYTATYQAKPSIFEVIAQKSLNDVVHPALQKIALVLATSFPQKFGWLNKYYEETFLALNGLLQYHYLKFYDSSFSENFYGLKRVLANNEKLQKRQQELSLIFLVVIPYFRRKLDEKISMIKIEEADGYLRQDFDGKMKRLLIFVHSSCEVIWGILSMYYYLEYMANNTEFQTPLLKMIDVKLIYDIDMHPSLGFWSDLFNKNLSSYQLGFGLVRNVITTTLGVGAFFLQFLQTWEAEKPNYNFTDIPRVAPPPYDTKAKNYQGKCPICLRPWIIPTVLQVSGYIFCFRCILKHLHEHQRCPVTNLPAKPLDVVRLYIQ